MMKLLAAAAITDQHARDQIGARIKFARREAGLTQKRLAELIEVTPRTIQGYEAGTIDVYRKLHRIAAVVERPVSWFQYGDADLNETFLRQIVNEELREVREILGRLEALLRAGRPPTRKARP
jgi:transcriptional regulator with XRE-family HTH domain